MAHGNPTVSLEVCNRAYEWNQMNPENCGGDEVEGYVELDYHKSCTPSTYQTMFSRKQTKKAKGEEHVVTSQPPKIIRSKGENHQDNSTKKASRSTQKPPTHLCLAVASLFICIFCWPAAPCAVLATIYGMQVSHHWMTGHHHSARSASSKAKELATAALVCGGINAVLCFILTLTSILVALGITGYLSKQVPV